MTETKTDKKIENTETQATVETNNLDNSKSEARTTKREFVKNKRRPFKRKERPKPEFDSKIIDIRRVARVSKGGRRFSFSVVVIAGDRKGRVGVGTGKAGDTALAVEKATKSAIKTIKKINTTKTNSIPFQVEAKYCSARVIIMPAPGRGLIAGSALRDIIEYAGLQDLNAKIISGSKNKLNIARASIKALESLKTLNKKVEDAKKETKTITNKKN